jgi:hypothetical protein
VREVCSPLTQQVCIAGQESFFIKKSKENTMSKFVLLFSTLALTAGFAADSYKVNLTSPVTVGSTTLKAGEYKVQVEGTKATFKMGKESVELPVVVEVAPAKFKETQLGTVNPGAQLKEINIGGTTTKLMFKAPSATANAGGGE